MNGDPAPGTGGGVLAQVSGYSLNEDDEIAFLIENFVTGGIEGIFLATPSPDEPEPEVPGVPASSPGGRMALILALMMAAVLLAQRTIPRRSGPGSS